MLTAIDFDRQPILGAGEIDNEIADRMLSPELVPQQAAIAQRRPHAPFGISIATASVAGALLIIIQPVEPSIGRDYIGRIFAICVLGGMTSFPGMLAGAMLIGIVESTTATFYGPSWAPAVAFGFLLLTLAVRPAGILGR